MRMSRARHALGHRTAFPPVLGLITRIHRALRAEEEQRWAARDAALITSGGRSQIVLHDSCPKWPDVDLDIPPYCGDLGAS